MSDFHFGAEPNQTIASNVAKTLTGDPKASLFATHDSLAEKALLSAVKNLCTPPHLPVDLVLITGDLGTTGEEKDLSGAAEFLRNLCRRTHTYDPPEVFILPGNHDRYGSVGGLVGPTFERTFPRYWPEYYGDQRQWAGAVIEKPDENGATHRLGILAFDFSLPEEHLEILRKKNRLGIGQVLARLHRPLLIETTQRMRAKFPNIVVIWAMHFPPSKAVAADFILKNYSVVQKAANRLAIPLIIAGHIHEKQKYGLAGNGEIWVAGSALQYNEKRGHWFHMVEITTEATQIRKAFRYNFKSKNYYFEWQRRVDALGERAVRDFSAFEMSPAPMIKHGSLKRVGEVELET